MDIFTDAVERGRARAADMRAGDEHGSNARKLARLIERVEIVLKMNRMPVKETNILQGALQEARNAR